MSWATILGIAGVQVQLLESYELVGFRLWALKPKPWSWATMLDIAGVQVQLLKSYELVDIFL